jgi:hypothetical protein
MGMMHFVGGEKGGVGKSVMSRLLSQYFIDRDIPYIGMDADQSHPTLTRYYEDFTQPVNLDYFESIDKIAEQAFESDNAVLVDLPAQSQRFLDRWIEDNDVLALCSDLQIPLVYWYVTDDGKDSAKLAEKFLTKYGDALTPVIVKNFGCGKDFSDLEEGLGRWNSLNAQSLRQVSLPALHDVTMRKVDKSNFSFWAATHLSDGAGPKLGIMERQRVKVWLKKSYAAIDEVLASFA